MKLLLISGNKSSKKKINSRDKGLGRLKFSGLWATDRAIISEHHARDLASAAEQAPDRQTRATD